MCDGIAVAGNIICDIIKTVDAYPPCGTLADIKRVSKSVGGCVPNTAINLAKLGDVKVKALGAVGDDAEGQFVIDELKTAGVCVGGIIVRSEHTSFTDVMSVEGGERTFFHMRGVNAVFGPDDIDLDALNCKILHVGYHMLLDKFDAADAKHGTVMAGFLKEVQKKGIKTSIDVVSQSGGDFRRTVLPGIKYCDYVIINELEAGQIVGIEPRDKADKLLVNNIKKILEELIKCGVREKAIIHCPEGGFCLCRKAGYNFVPSLKLPKGYVVGKVGAGDAFCAGALYGIYKCFDDAVMLDSANRVAARNLAFCDSVLGACSLEDALKATENL